jgi:hypothetical protein
MSGPAHELSELLAHDPLYGIFGNDDRVSETAGFTASLHLTPALFERPTEKSRTVGQSGLA